MSCDGVRAPADEGLRAVICDTLVSMLAEGSYPSISVRQLARRAHVARSSFYRHFASKDDALVYYTQLEYDRFIAEGMGSAPLDAERGPEAFLRERIDFVRRHAGYFRILARNDLLDRAFAHLDLDTADVLSGGAASGSPYARALFAGASAGVIKCWIQRDFRESEDELAALLMEARAQAASAWGAVAPSGS